MHKVISTSHGFRRRMGVGRFGGAGLRGGKGRVNAADLRGIFKLTHYLPDALG